MIDSKIIVKCYDIFFQVKIFQCFQIIKKIIVISNCSYDINDNKNKIITSRFRNLSVYNSTGFTIIIEERLEFFIYRFNKNFI